MLCASRRMFFAALLIAAASLPTVTSNQARAAGAGAATAAEIDAEVDDALATLYATEPVAKDLGQQAKGTLVFPTIIKAGLGIGGALGEGALRVDGKTEAYYSSFAASFGLQAGAQTFSYALFFMTDDSLKFIRETSGWEIGMGPSVVVVDAGLAKKMSTTTLKDDVYAFIYGQKGLMAGLGIEGSKITQFTPPEK
jgi:lipid-binding SYLF domain-containing protein